MPAVPPIWRALLASGTPIRIGSLECQTAGLGSTAVREGLARLDAEDLILLEDGLVRLAYPFSGDQTPFTIVLADGRARFVCCAVDALGIAPMLGQPITIRSHCHHCKGPIQFAVDPEGPGPGAAGVMVWIGRRDPDERRACTGHERRSTSSGRKSICARGGRRSRARRAPALRSRRPSGSGGASSAAC